MGSDGNGNEDEKMHKFTAFSNRARRDDEEQTSQLTRSRRVTHDFKPYLTLTRSTP